MIVSDEEGELAQQDTAIQRDNNMTIDLEKEVWKEVFRSQYGRIIPLDKDFKPGQRATTRRIGLDEAIEVATEKAKYFRKIYAK